MIDDQSDPAEDAEWDAIIAKLDKMSRPDVVNSPPHYTVGGIETIDFIQAKLSPEEFAGYCRGNMLKYIARAGHKDDAGQDMRKALWYGERWLRARDASAKKS